VSWKRNGNNVKNGTNVIVGAGAPTNVNDVLIDVMLFLRTVKINHPRNVPHLLAHTLKSLIASLVNVGTRRKKTLRGVREGHAKHRRLMVAGMNDLAITLMARAVGVVNVGQNRVLQSLPLILTRSTVDASNRKLNAVALAVTGIATRIGSETAGDGRRRGTSLVSVQKIIVPANPSPALPNHSTHATTSALRVF
jgi:hypothetical protein